MHLSPPMVRRVILLVGPTQVGKSSVANFLIDSIVDADKNKLKVGYGTESCTQQPQCENFTYSYELGTDKKYAEFSVIDTAGAGDSGENDADNMVALYKYLLEENIEISCVALVVKYPTLADHQYKSIIGFYKKMLSTALRKKIIVVLTHAEMKNAGWVKRLKRTSGKDPHEVIIQITDNIRSSLELEEIRFHAFDTLAEVGEEDYLHALDCRRKILEGCINSVGFRPDQLAFPKSIRWHQTDQAKAAELDASGKDILKLVDELRTGLSSLAINISNCRSRISGFKEAIRASENEIEKLDNDTMAEILKSRSQLSFHFFGATAYFDLQLDHQIADVQATEGTLTIQNKTEKTVKGIVEGKYFSGLDTTVIILGRSREVYEKDIKRLELEVKSTKQDLARQKERLQQMKTEVGRKENEIRGMEQKRQDGKEEMAILQADTLTLDQVRKYVK